MLLVCFLLALPVALHPRRFFEPPPNYLHPPVPLRYTELSLVADIVIGTPGQTISVIVDTGSSDLWVSTFNSAQSLTFTDTRVPFSMVYEDGTNATGVWATDTVQISPATVPAYQFGVVEKAPMSGVLGLGFRENESADYDNLLIRMRNQGSIATEVFAIDFGDLSGEGAQMWFGVHPAVAALLRVLVIAGSRQYALMLTGVVFNGRLSGGPVTFDSGSTVSTFTHELYERVKAAVGATYSAEVDDYVAPCSTNSQEVVFEFGDKSFGIPLSRFTIPVGGGVCAFALEVGDEVTLGWSSLRGWTIVFDVEGRLVGFNKRATSPPPSSTTLPTGLSTPMLFSSKADATSSPVGWSSGNSTTNDSQHSSSLELSSDSGLLDSHSTAEAQLKPQETHSTTTTDGNPPSPLSETPTATESGPFSQASSLKAGSSASSSLPPSEPGTLGTDGCTLSRSNSLRVVGTVSELTGLSETTPTSAPSPTSTEPHGSSQPSPTTPFSVGGRGPVVLADPNKGYRQGSLPPLSLTLLTCLVTLGL